ncbi:hypothetical protein CMO91_00425 [Candidatus Woesearchaeota archaeon]|nr:hypothetical protein [Candidatus Woesearchaeota archaeon]
MRNTIALAIAVLLVLPTVSAIADITYEFNVNNIEVEAYDCLDAKCKNVRGFSGSFPNGQTTNNGKLLVRYPSTLATQYGYAMYYFSPNYLVFEGKATWHTFGDGGTATAKAPVTMTRKAVCRAQIDNFEVINDAYANVPVVIDVAASMDADTHSAFGLVNNNIDYIPPHRKAQYYSVDTEVTLIVEDPNNRESRQVKTYNGNNAIFADTKVKTKFTYTPTKTGRHEATIRAKVIDSQCASQQTQNSKKNFKVLPALPRNECYTLVNNLRAEPGPTTSIFVSKISNYATNFPPNDPRYQLIPVRTELEYTIDLADGSDVDRDTLLAANPNSRDPVTHKEVFTLPPGSHKVTVQGASLSPLCNKRSPETVSTTFFVPPAPTFSVSFTVLDNEGNKVNGAEVSLSGRKQSTVNGVTVFTKLAPSTYTYAITHAKGKAKGQVQVNTDKFLTVVLQPETFLLTINVKDKDTGAPLNAEVAIAGQILQTPGGQAKIRLTKGTYPLTATKPGFETVSRNVNLDGDKAITIQLKSIPPKTFTLGVTTVNAANQRIINDVDVNVGGVVKKTVNGRAAFDVKQGSHLVVASKAGFRPGSVTVDVQQNKEIILEMAPVTRTHQLTLVVQDQNGAPTNATASIAGQTFSVNGQASVTVPEGTHTLVVTKPGFITHQETVVMDTDKTVTVRLQPVSTSHALTIVVRDQGAPTTATASIAGQTLQVNGQITISLPANTYTLVVTKPGFLTRQQTVALTSDLVVTVDLQRVPPNQFNLGVIVIDEPTQTPLNGADVVVAGQTKQTVGGRADFSLANGTYDILVSKAGFQTGRATVNLQGNLDVTFQLRPVAPVQHTLTFLITDGQTSNPISGATVTAGGQSRTTNAAGVASFVLTAATYTYTIRAASFLDATGTVNLNQDTTVAVALQRTPPGTFNLGVIVVDEPTQTPLNGVDVVVAGQTKQTVGGRADFSLTPGTYDILASKAGFQTGRVTVNLQSNQDVTIQIRPVAPVQHTLTFVVTDGASPVQGANVSAGGRSQLTNSAGVASFVLPAATYTYTITTGGIFTPETGTINLNQDTTLVVSLTRPVFTLTVLTQDQNSQPLDGVSVLVGGTTRLTVNGRADFTVARGTHLVQASKIGFTPVQTTVDVQQDTSVTLTLQPQVVRHTAFFLVTNIFTAQPISGATIQVSGSTLVTDVAGRANVSLAAGQHTFTASAAGFGSEQATFTLNQDININVAMTPATSSLQKATFTVLDARTRDPIEGVKIDFQGVATLTNRQGKATILNVQNGTFTAKASHDSYLTITRVVTIAGDKDVTILLPRNPDVEFDDDSFAIRLENINIQPISYDGMVPITVEFKNSGNKEIENVRVVANLLGEFGRAGTQPVDLRPNNRVTQRLIVWTDGAQGTYWLRVTVGNGKHSRTIHREVTFY